MPYIELKRQRLHLHEDNQYVIGALTHLTSMPPTMMCELQKQFLFIDTYDIKIRTQYNRSSDNAWAEKLSRVNEKSD